MSHFSHLSRRSPNRSGASSLEVIIAFTLLTGVLTASATLLVRNGRLLASQRHYRLALDELSNQMEQLSALSADELPKAVEQLTPSPFAVERLPGAKLQAELHAGDMGQRVTLSLQWQEPQRESAPVRLTAWVFPKPDQQSDTGGDQP